MDKYVVSSCFEGRMISVAGAIIGIALGLLLCWLQQTYGLVQLGDQAGNFVVNAYPISVHPEDIIVIFVTVILVGLALRMVSSKIYEPLSSRRNRIPPAY